MKGVTVILLSAVLTLTAGCATTGGIRSRATLVDPSHLQAGSAVTSLAHNAPWPETDWWNAFNDPQLNGLIRQAVSYRPDLQAARARLDVAQYQARIAGASLRPRIDTQAQFSRERFARYTTASPPGGFTVWNNEVSVELGYDLDLWGRDKATLTGAVDTAKASAAEYQAVRIALEVAVVRAYVQLWMQYRLLDAYRRLFDQSMRARNIVAERLHAGLSSPLEMSQADTEVAVNADNLEQAKRQIALLRNELGTLSGQGPGAGDALERPDFSIDYGALIPHTLPADLLGRRPDIVARRWRVEAAAQQIKVARAAFYPNVDLIALASLGSLATFGGFDNFLNKKGASHQLGVALSLPLFDGGRRQGEYGVAVASYDGAVDAYNQAVLDALQQAANEVTVLKSLQNESKEAKLASDSADRAYALATLGYRRGITEFLEVLVAQNTQVRQQQVLIVTEARELDAWVLLIHALGGGYAPVQSSQRTPLG